MLMPKRTKFRRPHRLSYEGHAKGNSYISFGDYGLMASEGTYITAQQLEAARIALTRKMKRGGNVWCRIFPHMAKTKKPLEVRMGSGKGSPELWVAVVKKGTIMFEISGVPEDIAREAFRLAMHKLPIKCTIVKRTEEQINAPITTKTLKKMTKLAADKNLANSAINQETLSKGVANE